MAQLNFPANPQVGDPYEPAGLNVIYVWNGTVWEATVPVNDSAAFVPLDGSGEMTGDLQTTGVICNNTGTDTVLIDLQRNSGDMLKVTAAPNVEVVQPLNLVLPDDSALPFRIMEGTNEYLRVTTTDDAEQFTFKKGVTTTAVLTLSNDVTCSSAQDINVQNSAGTALRVMNAGTTELFRFNTNVSPNVADFSCAVKLDGDVEAAFGTLTVSQDLNVQLESSSNALDFLSDDGQFALRFNTSNEQLITDFDIYNDNNDAVIGLGGTIASPSQKIYPGNIQSTGMLQIATTSSTLPLVFGSDTSYTFLAPDSTTAMTRFVVQSTGDNTINIPDVAGDMAVDQSNGIHFSLLQQTGSSGFPANSGTSHFYSDVSIGFTGSQSQLSSSTHLSKFTIQRNFAGNEGGLIVKGGRPGEAGNGTQNILAVHYQDVVAGDDIRYHGSTAHNNSLQNKTSVNGLIDNKLNPSAISSNATSVTLKQPTTTDSTLTMGGNLLPASSSIDIGTQSSKFNNIYVSQINDTGDLVVSGDIFLGNNALDTLSMRAAIITSLSTSSSSNTIGSSTAPWGTIYTAKSVQAGIDSTSHSAHISMNEDGSLKLWNLTGLSQLTVTPSTGLLALISNKLYIYIATGWKEVNLTTATPPS